MAQIVKRQSKGYLGNPNIKKSGELVDYTEEDVNEYAKCMIDPIYFITKYVKITTLDHGIQPFELFEYQKKFIACLHENRKVIGLWPRQHGKCLGQNAKINIRNKTTHEIYEITIGQFYQWQLFRCLPQDQAMLALRD